MNTKPHPTPESLVAKLEAKKRTDTYGNNIIIDDCIALVRQHESETAAERDRLRQEVELLVKQIEYILQNDHSLNAELIRKVLTKQSTRTSEASNG